MARLLDTFDRWAADRGLDADAEAPHRFAPTRLPASRDSSLDLRSGEIADDRLGDRLPPRLLLAGGARARPQGTIRHDGGVAASPGLYVMGLPFMRRRKSTLIDGAADDARELADHLARHLAGQPWNGPAPADAWHQAA